MSDARAVIPRPSICRKVVLSRRDGQPLIMLGPADQAPVLVAEAPADVVGVEREDDLVILCLIGSRWYRAPHADLAAVNYPGDMMVWRWPPRT